MTPYGMKSHSGALLDKCYTICEVTVSVNAGHF